MSVVSADPPLRLLPFERYHPGAFVGVFGALRSGKTLMACRLAVCLARSLGLDLVGNIPVRGARRIFTLDDLAALRGAVLVWDEVQVSLDSREWASDGARQLTRDMILWGKRGIVCVYTSPSFATVDVRLRRLTQYVYVTAGRFRRSGADYAVYRWHEHPYADERTWVVALEREQPEGEISAHDAHHDASRIPPATAPAGHHGACATRREIAESPTIR